MTLRGGQLVVWISNYPYIKLELFKAVFNF
jgi:hypothetical protein